MPCSSRKKSRFYCKGWIFLITKIEFLASALTSIHYNKSFFHHIYVAKSPTLGYSRCNTTPVLTRPPPLTSTILSPHAWWSPPPHTYLVAPYPMTSLQWCPDRMLSPCEQSHQVVGSVVGRVTQVAANYRPVSLTCVLGRVMEKVMRDQMIAHLLKNSLIRSSQHGSQQGRSTTTNLLE